MFGQDLIIGHSEGKITDKGRIFLPSFTSPEPHDKILIQITTTINKQTALKLFSYNQYLQIIKGWQNLRAKTTTVEDYERCTKMIEQLSSLIHSLLEIDNQKRLLLPKSILESLGWETKDTIEYTGLGESLQITKK